MKLALFFFAGALAVAGLETGLAAASIQWGPTGTVLSPADVSTNGTLIGALNLGRADGAQTINGVTFANDPGPGQIVVTGSLIFTAGYTDGINANFWTPTAPGGSSAYGIALDSARFNGTQMTLSLGGLQPGKAYELQIWAVDTRPQQVLRDRTGTFTCGQSVTLTYGGTLATTPGPQWAIGTFTADGTSVTITNTAAVPQINLIQLRQIDAAPPPTVPTTFRILQAVPDPSNARLSVTWESSSYYVYRVESAESLATSTWSTELTNVASQGTSTTASLAFSSAAVPRVVRVARDYSGDYYRLPPTNLNLVLGAPISTWDEAIPLGNGLLGGLLWGQGNLIRLSLDRGDLWDERPAAGFRSNDFNYATMKQVAAARNQSEFDAIFDSNWNGPHPTKIPAGRLEITLDPSQQVKRFELNLASAEGRAWFTNGTRLDSFFNATAPVSVIQIPGPAPAGWRLLTPASLSQLGYPAAQTGAAGNLKWFLQPAADGLAYCVCAGAQSSPQGTIMAATVTSTHDGADPVQIARDRVTAALAAGYDAQLQAHKAWWEQFWRKSAVVIPETPILQHYYLVRYFYGAASRRGAKPMPLQGVWTADAGELPPWKGDYHNDLNTQMTYLAYYTSGNFDEGACFLDFLWDLLPSFRTFATNFFAEPGAAVPGVMSLAGQPLGGWGQYSLSPTMGAWCGHLFYLHWRYTGDTQFLHDRAYPWCSEIGLCLRSLLVADTNGMLKLPLSSSPEIYDNTMSAFLTPNSNFDLATMKMFFLALEEMAAADGRPTEAASWAASAAALGPFAVNGAKALRIDPVRDIPYNHRHFSNLMGIHPYNLITVDGGSADQAIIDASLAQYEGLGTSYWCGYSFSWMACLRARVGKAESALRNLDIYQKAFILRNGFHANGDQTRSGFSSFTYRPFTLEGNFLGMQAVHEMLLQSWNAQPGSGAPGILRIFPAMPWRWHDAAFYDLRAEGGHRVSAMRENNATVWLRVVAGSSGVVKIRDNFGGRTPVWSRSDVTRAGNNFEVQLAAGESVEATLPRPASVPPAPADLAEPVVVPPPYAIQVNTLPFRIGADTSGGSRFDGDMARPALFSRALTDGEIAQLASTNAQTGDSLLVSDCLVALDLGIRTNGSFANLAQNLPAQIVGTVIVSTNLGTLPGPAFTLDGSSYLNIANHALLSCTNGVTLAAWIRPHQLPASGARILDKTPVGAATGYLLDTYPGNSLRFITRDPHLGFSANLSNNVWNHVAATQDGETGKQVLYLNGVRVAETN